MTRKIHFISEWYFNPFKQSFLSCLTQSQKKKKWKKEKQTKTGQTHSPISTNADSEAGDKAREMISAQSQGPRGRAQEQRSLWSFYWVGVLGPDTGFAHSVTLFSRGQAHKECVTEKSDAEEDETAHSSRMCPRGQVKRTETQEKAYSNPGDSGRSPPGQTAGYLQWECAALVRSWKSLYSGEGAELHPEPESQLLADAGLTGTLVSLSAVIDTLKPQKSLETKWRINLLHSENAKWHLPIATANVQLVLGEPCHIKPARGHRFGFLSLVFIGLCRIQWFF